MTSQDQSRFRIVRGVGANIFTHAVIAAIQLATVPVLASHWGLNLYGWWVLVSTIPTYIALGDLGFATAAGIDMTMKVARGDREGAIETFTQAWTAITALSITLCVVGASIVWLLPAKYFVGLTDVTTAKVVMILLIIQAVAAMHGSIFLAGFRCCGLYAFGAMSQAFIMLCEGLVVICVALAGGSPVGAAIGTAAFRCTGVFLQSRFLARRAPWLKMRPTKISSEQIRRLLQPSLGIIALSAGQAIFLQGTTLVVGAVLSSASAAVFSSVRTLSRIGVQSTALLNRAIAPEFSMIAARGERTKQARVIGFTVLSSLLLLAPVATILFSYGPGLVALWSANVIRPSFSLVAAMTVVMLLHGFWMPLFNYVVAVNRHAGFSYAYLALSVSSVLLAYPLTSWWGEAGAAVALVALDSVMLVISCILVLTQLCSLSEILMAMKGDCTAAVRTLRSITRVTP